MKSFGFLLALGIFGAALYSLVPLSGIWLNLGCILFCYALFKAGTAVEWSGPTPPSCSNSSCRSRWVEMEWGERQRCQRKVAQEKASQEVNEIGLMAVNVVATIMSGGLIPIAPDFSLGTVNETEEGWICPSCNAFSRIMVYSKSARFENGFQRGVGCFGCLGAIVVPLVGIAALL